MLHNRLVSALKKIGAEVTDITRGDNPHYRHFTASLGRETIDWHTQENFNDKKGEFDGRLYVSFVTKSSPDTDVMTDYFADSHEETIKGAVNLLKGP